MRHSATKALLERNDVLIVASVSCIYGLGSPEAYFDMLLFLECNAPADRDRVLRKLVDIQYERNDIDFHRGTFRVRGDVVEIFPVSEEARAMRVEFFGDTVEAIAEIDPLRGQVLRRWTRSPSIPPVTTSPTPERMEQAVAGIRARAGGAHRGAAQPRTSCSRAQRLEQRTLYDLEMLQEMGFCNGIENYSRHLDRPRTRRAAADADQLLPRRLAAVHRREPRHRAADRRHVSRRPLAQGDAGRVRLPPAVGARQPAAELRGVRSVAQDRDLRVGDARRLRARASRRRGGRAAHPADRAASIRRSSCARRASRSTTCSKRSASASNGKSACW